jgi:hypothetical protein
MIACFDIPYIGATGKGYKPAFDAVHIIEPFLPDEFFRR